MFFCKKSGHSSLLGELPTNTSIKDRIIYEMVYVSLWLKAPPISTNFELEKSKMALQGQQWALWGPN